MRIGIIGAGNVGGTLGTRWAKGGHQVVFSSREPGSSKMRALTEAAGSGSWAATVENAVAASDILLLSTPWPATGEALAGLDFTGKVIIDATNPLLGDLSGLAMGTTTSGGEQVAHWAKGARVVKAFNTVGYNIMADAQFGADRPVMFYCGDDLPAKRMAQELINELGFDAVDAGPLRQARLLEPMALLWISLALQFGQGREMAFKLMKR